MQSDISKDEYAAFNDYDRYFNSQDAAYDAALSQLNTAAQTKIQG